MKRFLSSFASVAKQLLDPLFACAKHKCFDLCACQPAFTASTWIDIESDIKFTRSWMLGGAVCDAPEAAGSDFSLWCELSDFQHIFVQLIDYLKCSRCVLSLVMLCLLSGLCEFCARHAQF
jgi:hypothetical protein